MEAVVWMHDTYVGSLVIPAPTLTAAYAAVPTGLAPSWTTWSPAAAPCADSPTVAARLA
ncbi:hypothetical protein [Nonomuraea sp. NPDC049684]|uniref:hypothetical protein n=1 Tax=unclassified Nonomuraea TaxID=2593643 RepID=UPI00378EF5B9